MIDEIFGLRSAVRCFNQDGGVGVGGEGALDLALDVAIVVACELQTVAVREQTHLTAL